jgi:hypothetical protein
MNSRRRLVVYVDVDDTLAHAEVEALNRSHFATGSQKPS